MVSLMLLSLSCGLPADTEALSKQLDADFAELLAREGDPAARRGQCRGSGR
jgi:hypothetical protein